MHFSTLGYFSYFFVKLCNSYLIKCKKEKMKEKKFRVKRNRARGKTKNHFNETPS
jgi:hypothetical protein